MLQGCNKSEAAVLKPDKTRVCKIHRRAAASSLGSAREAFDEGSAASSYSGTVKAFNDAKATQSTAMWPCMLFLFLSSI